MKDARSLRSVLVTVALLIAIANGLPAVAQGLSSTPVTFTQAGWHAQGQSLIYSSWRYAFDNFSFYGHTRRRWLYAGYAKTMSIEGSPSTLANLVNWFPQTATPGCLKTTQDFITPAPLPRGNSLAGEVVALTMNIAFNDERLMPRHPGYDLEKFTLRSGLMKGKTVGQVLDIADRVLGGDPPVKYGLANYQALVGILRSVNANYEFINYSAAINRGYLQPNRPLGRPDPPQDPHVP